MTVWHVRQGANGGGTSPVDALPSLAAAFARVEYGDKVIVAGGVYREPLRCPAGVEWQGAGDGEAIIDGGWNGKVDTENRGGFQVGIGLPEVVLRGLTIRNTPGQGIHIGAGGHNALIDGCTIHDCFDGAVVVSGEGGRVKGVRLLNTTMYHISRSWKIEKPPKGVGGCCRWRWAEDVVVRGCHLFAGYGEGIAAGIQTRGMVIENNVIHDLMHLAIYVNHAVDVIVRGNVIYQTGDPLYAQPDGDVGTGINVGDETRGKDDRDEGWQFSENVLVEGNVVIGTGVLFAVSNGGQMKGSPPVWDGYDTRIRNLTVRNNTFVAGPRTKIGVTLQANRAPSNAVAGRFEDNVIVMDGAKDGAPVLVHTAAGIVAVGNFWTIKPAKLSPADFVAAPLLVGPLAVGGTAEANDFDLAHYRPLADGPLVVDGVAVAGALEPVVVPPLTTPDPPESPPVDVAALRARAAAVGVQLATLAQAREAASAELVALVDMLGEYGQ